MAVETADTLLRSRKCVWTLPVRTVGRRRLSVGSNIDSAISVREFFLLLGDWGRRPELAEMIKSAYSALRSFCTQLLAVERSISIQ